MAAIAEVGAGSVEKALKESVPVNVSFGVFFDGTQNHRIQVLIAKKYRQKYGNIKDNQSIEDTILADSDYNKMDFTQDEKYSVNIDEELEDLIDESISAQSNDFSNIALLEPYYQSKAQEMIGDNEFVYRIYVSGCGTSRKLKNKGSKLFGSGFGYLSTGVVQKVKDAINAIKSKLIKYDKPCISEVNIDYHIFGFSRGAAEARLFVNVLSKSASNISLVKKTTKTKTIKKGKNVSLISNQKTISIPFVGLFDTVSSIGTPANHKNNVNDYGLNVLAQAEEVKNIFHICALDEYRANFSLTPVPECEKLLEIYIPGAHSDIGGGYAVGYDGAAGILKNNYLSEFPLSDNFIHNVSTVSLMDLGWYNETKTNKDILLDENDDVVVLNRYSKKGYNYIALHLMSDYACAKVSNIFQKIDKFDVPSDLKSIYDDFKNRFTTDKILYPSKKQYKMLRTNYLHFSSKDNLPDSIVCHANLERNIYKRKRYV